MDRNAANPVATSSSTRHACTTPKPDLALFKQCWAIAKLRGSDCGGGADAGGGGVFGAGDRIEQGDIEPSLWASIPDSKWASGKFESPSLRVCVLIGKPWGVQRLQTHITQNASSSDARAGAIAGGGVGILGSKRTDFGAIYAGRSRVIEGGFLESPARGSLVS